METSLPGEGACACLCVCAHVCTCARACGCMRARVCVVRVGIWASP